MKIVNRQKKEEADKRFVDLLRKQVQDAFLFMIVLCLPSTEWYILWLLYDYYDYVYIALGSIFYHDPEEGAIVKFICLYLIFIIKHHLFTFFYPFYF